MATGVTEVYFRKGLKEKFETIRSLAIGHMKSDFSPEEAYDSASGIIQTYRATRKLFEERIKEVGLLEDIPIPLKTFSYHVPETKREIRMVISNCAAAVAFLLRGEQEVPADVRNKLDALLEQIIDVQKLSPNLHTHLAESVREHEAARYLASSVLAAKSIDYVISKLPGDDEISKAEFLVKKGLLKKDLKDGWVLT